MSVLFIEYPKCSTCIRAKKWLAGRNIGFTDRNIVEENPKADELKVWIERSGLSSKKFFNTSGRLYKEMHLKDKLESVSEDDRIALLASDGMLVKRPLIIADDFILIGFKEAEWERKMGLDK